MSTPLLIANLLLLLAFFVHTFIGDRELRILEPSADNKQPTARAVWTMVRCGWHWISFDLLFATIALGVINFSELIVQEYFLLQVLMIYFLAYGLVWLITIIISKPFAQNYLKLGQWILLWTIGGLIYWGIA